RIPTRRRPRKSRFPGCFGRSEGNPSQRAYRTAKRNLEWKLLDFHRRLQMAEKKTQKCAHPACQCLVSGDEKDCSTYCHDAGDTMEISCNCDHPGCSLAEAV